MEGCCDVVLVRQVRRVEVVGCGAILEIKIGEEDSIASGGGVVGGEDAEGGLAGAAFDRGEAD